MSAMADKITAGLAEPFGLMADTLSVRRITSTLAAQPRTYAAAVDVAGRIHDIAQRHRQDEFGNWRHFDTCQVRVLASVSLSEGDLVAFGGVTWRISGRSTNGGRTVAIYNGERDTIAVVEPRGGGTP